jgi:hypothetical protein
MALVHQLNAIHPKLGLGHTATCATLRITRKHIITRDPAAAPLRFRLRGEQWRIDHWPETGSAC